MQKTTKVLLLLVAVTPGKVIKHPRLADPIGRTATACAIISSRKNHPAASRRRCLVCVHFRDIVKVNNRAATPLISAATSDPRGRGFSEKKTLYFHCFAAPVKPPTRRFNEQHQACVN